MNDSFFTYENLKTTIIQKIMYNIKNTCNYKTISVINMFISRYFSIIYIFLKVFYEIGIFWFNL